MAQNIDLIEVNKRLGVVIALLLRQIPKAGECLSLREQVGLLAGLGLRPKEIAEIIGRTQTYVNKELVTLRKTKKKAK